jgi:pantothenate kinase
LDPGQTTHHKCEEESDAWMKSVSTAIWWNGCESFFTPTYDHAIADALPDDCQ